MLWIAVKVETYHYIFLHITGDVLPSDSIPFIIQVQLKSKWRRWVNKEVKLCKAVKAQFIKNLKILYNITHHKKLFLYLYSSIPIVTYFSPKPILFTEEISVKFLYSLHKHSNLLVVSMFEVFCIKCITGCKFPQKQYQSFYYISP